LITQERFMRISTLCRIVILSAALLLCPVVAQVPDAGPASADTLPLPGVASVPTDTLFLQGRTIAIFRTPVFGYTPQQRVQDAHQRLERIIASGKADSVNSQRMPRGMLISVSGQGAFFITPGDLDSLSGESLDEVGARTVRSLTQALEEDRQSRSLTHIIRGALFTALATVVLWLLIRLIVLGHRFLSGRIQKIVDARVTKVATERLEVVSASRTLATLQRLITLLAWILGVFSAFVWLTFSLRRFPLTRPWGDAMREHSLALLKQFALAIVGTIPDLIALVLIFLFTRLAMRLVRAFFAAIEAHRIELPWLHVDTLLPTRRIVMAMLWVLALVVAYPYLPGSHTDAFKGISVFIGLVLSLGSTGIMNQAMSGLVLMYSRAFRVGDYVRIADTEGMVTSLGMLSTKIRTNKREEVNVPNAVILGTTVKNFSRLAEAQGVIVDTAVTIGYSTPWRQVHAMLIMAAERTPGLRREPPPFVLQAALSDFYVDYRLCAYLEKPETRVRILSLLHANIQDVFNEHGVQIMSPHYESDPAAPVWVPKEKWFESPAKSQDL
jgi:small-conductance mechanosensitive channel